MVVEQSPFEDVEVQLVQRKCSVGYKSPQDHLTTCATFIGPFFLLPFPFRLALTDLIFAFLFIF